MIINLVLIIIILFQIFQIFRIIDAINNGKYLLSTVRLPINKISKCLDLLEQSNSDAYIIIRLKATWQILKIIKKQDKYSWWFEIIVPEENIVFFKEKLSSSEIPATVSNNNNIFFLGTDKEKISILISQYLCEKYKIKSETNAQITFKKTRIDESIINYIFPQLAQ